MKNKIILCGVLFLAFESFVLNRAYGDTIRDYTTITSTIDNALGQSYNIFHYPHHTKMFYIKGRIWVFYQFWNQSGQTRMLVFKSSTDGITWSERTEILNVTIGDGGYSFDLDLKGYFHIAVLNKTSENDLLYRRGEPQADGTINWDSWQTVISGVLHVGESSFVSADSDGYPWIVYRSVSSLNVTKSSTNDGTWQTATGFPKFLTPVGCGTGGILRLTQGKMYIWAYNTTSSPDVYDGFLWDGSTWIEEPAFMDGGDLWAGQFSLVADDDTIWLGTTLYDDPDYLTPAIYKRDYVNGWMHIINFTTIRTDLATGQSAIQIEPKTDNIWFFFRGYTAIYYRRRINENWDSYNQTLSTTVNDWAPEDWGISRISENKIGIGIVVNSQLLFEQIEWQSTSSLGYYNLRVHVTSNMVPLMGAIVQVNGENKTTDILGDAYFELPYGKYKIKAYVEDKQRTRHILLNGDTSIGIDFNIPKKSNRRVTLFVAFPLGFVIAIAVLLFLWRKR